MQWLSSIAKRTARTVMAAVTITKIITETAIATSAAANKWYIICEIILIILYLIYKNVYFLIFL